MRSHLFKIKVVFFLVSMILMGGIFIAQNRFAVIRSLASETDPMQQAIEKKFAYLKDRKLEPFNRVLGATTDASESARSIQVLYYHGISEDENKEDVSFSNFKDQMYKMKENGFETITSKQLEDFLLHGQALPPRSFLLTFDDGRKDSFYPVDPVLKALNYHATMFLISSEVKDRDIYYLTENEIKDMLKTGRWEIQAHTRDSHKYERISSDGQTGHALTNKLWLNDHGRKETDEEYKDRIYSDLFSSKQDLEKRFGVPVQHFAFPFGDYGQSDTNYPQAREVIDQIIQQLYRFAYYQPWDGSSTRNIPYKDTRMIRRIGIEPSWLDDDLIKMVLRGEDKYLPYVENFEAGSWEADWGKIEVAGHSLKITAGSTTTGASSLIQGSAGWQNFQASLSAVLSTTTDSVSILGRVNESQDYSECVFTRDGIYYREKYNGESDTYDKKLVDLEDMFAADAGLLMTINGSKVVCGTADGTELESIVRRAPSEVSRFGIGIWSNKKGKASAVVEELLITKPND